MTVMNPPIMVQGRADHNADDLRSAFGALLTPQGAGQSLRPRSGITPGAGDELAVSAAAPADMSVVVGSGIVVIPAPQDGHGSWSVVNDADLSLTIAPSDPTNPRSDLVIARVADAQYTAGGDDAADIRVVTGVAGPGAPAPAVPATEGEYVVLAQVAVGANVASITAGDITLNTSASRPYTVAAGGVLPVPNAAARPANPYVGQAIWQTDLGLLHVWNGNSWIAQVADATTQTLTNKTLTAPTINGGTLSGTFQGQSSAVLTSMSSVSAVGSLSLVDGAREIILGYGGSGGISIGNNGGATHPNGMVLWANGTNLFCRKPGGADVTIA
jgi:hypothetical protein